MQLPVCWGTVSFLEVWRAVQANSHEISSADFAAASAQQASENAKLHFLPRVYLYGQSYSTDDPGACFFGNLSQRSITTNDFIPAQLNHPRSHFYTNGGVGVALPLYEGGSKVALSEAQKYIASSARYIRSSVMVGEYAQTAERYAMLLVLLDNNQEISNLKNTLREYMQRYELETTTNPVGHAGFLAMQALDNRLNMLLLGNTTEQQAIQETFTEQGVKLALDEIAAESFRTFLQQYLPVPKTCEDSPQVRALSAHAMASKEYITINSASYLPQVGLFAQKNIYHGSRDNANSYVAGVYVQWNIFDPSTFGKQIEARLAAKSKKQHVLAEQQREKIAFYNMKKQLQTASSNLETLYANRSLLKQQFEETTLLFQNGAVNALQWVESVSRVLDTIVAIKSTEAEIVHISAFLLTTTTVKVPQ